MVDLYVKPSISGYNSSPPADDDSEVSANAVQWAKHINKIGNPLKTLLDAVNTGVDELSDKLFGNAVRADSAGGSITTSDYGKLIKTTNAVTLTLLAGADAGSNFMFAFYNADAAANLTIARNANNINGAASNLTITPGGAGIAFCDGTDWWVFNLPTLTGDNIFDGDQTIGTDTTARVLSINGPAGSERRIFGTTAGLSRWDLDLSDSIAETGSNAGSELRISRHDDAGVSLGVWLVARRSDGAVQAGALPTGGFAGADIWNFAQTPQVNNVSLITEEVFTASGTFTAKRTGDHVIFLQSGGGGGGGGSTGTGGGGGGGGAAGKSLIFTQSLTAGTGYTVTIGAGGDGGAAGLVGTIGGNSVFDATTVGGGVPGNGAGAASGGAAGGAASSAAGGAASGTGTAGEDTFSTLSGAGGAGGAGDAADDGGGGGAGGWSMFGQGAGGGAGGAPLGNGTAGGSALFPGAGGGGGGGRGDGGGTTGGAGGSGADGIAMVF